MRAAFDNRFTLHIERKLCGMKKGKIGFGTGIGAGRKVLFAVVLAAILAGAAGCSEKETVLLV